MAYVKTNWVNDSAPAINAANLNKIEQGIYDNADDVATLQGKTNFRIEEASSSSITVAGNSGTWQTVAPPNTGTAIAVVGWYINGSVTIYPYSVNLVPEGGRFALRNISSSSQTFTLTVRFLMID